MSVARHQHLPVMLPGDWAEHAACSDAEPDVFFPDKGGSPTPAKVICNGDDDHPACPVREQCLQFALDNDERFGVWGGLSERERRQLQRRRNGHPTICPDCHGPAATYAQGRCSTCHRARQFGRVRTPADRMKGVA